MGAGSLINLHTHTDFSDGSFPVQDIVAKAAEGGLTHLAITDHFETEKVRRCLIREDLPEYLRLVHSMDRKFNGGMRVLAGVEVDTNPDRCDLENLPIELLNRLDLVLLEYVNDVDMGGSTLDELDRLLWQIRVPCGLVHTDIELVFRGAAPEEVADLLARYNLFAEVNTASLYKRDGLAYYEAAERYYRAFRGKVKVSIGTDVHRTLAEVTNLRQGYEFIDRLGLRDDLLF